MSEKDELINNMMKELVDILKTQDVRIGASAILCLLIFNAQDSGMTKEAWLEDLSHAWDHYV